MSTWVIIHRSPLSGKHTGMNVSVDAALGNKESETTGKGYERARAILAAARAIFASQGYAGLAMRTIAARVDVNLSTVQHYFPSKDALLEALLLQTLQDYQAFVDRQVESEAGGSRLAKFEAVIDYFLDELGTSESNGVLCELFALANRNSFAAEVLDKMLTRARKVFRNLIRSLAPETPGGPNRTAGRADSGANAGVDALSRQISPATQ